MPDLADDYRSALKLGRRAFRQANSKGRYPYLPVLDEFLSPERLTQRVHLGLMQIPMESVVGTRTAGRTKAFAWNFMPILAEDTEFARKWMALCQAHLDEGIRDPIKVIEYLNRYYVEEGNKRVSVLKYFDASTIHANVVRILPERLEDHPLYGDYLEFYNLSRINFVEFSKPYGYTKLQRLVGKGEDEPWTDDERSAFQAAYYTFRRAYEAEGGKELGSTVADAMLAYMEVFGYSSIRTKAFSELRKDIGRVWEDIELQQMEEPIDVRLAPSQKSEGIVQRVLPMLGAPNLKVAFVHDENPDLSGWTYGHELGREYVQRVFEGTVETSAYFNALDDDPVEVIEDAVADGNTVIFTTSPRLQPASLKVAVEDPRLTVFNCSLNISHRYIRTYYARMYEAKFVAGVIAGALAGQDDVGYICDYPIPGQVAGINGFALGVQTANPFAKVRLEWSSVERDDTAEERLMDEGIWIISTLDLARLRDRHFAPFGLSVMTEAGAVNLAAPVWEWGVYYEKLIRQIQAKTLQTEYAGSSRALNYYWGMSAGVVKMQYSEELPKATRKMARMLERAICEGICKPFRGPLFDQEGNQILSGDDEQSLSAEQIINMQWLNENVIGSIPAWRDLSDDGRLTVGIAGVTIG